VHFLMMKDIWSLWCAFFGYWNFEIVLMNKEFKMWISLVVVFKLDIWVYVGYGRIFVARFKRKKAFWTFVMRGCLNLCKSLTSQWNVLLSVVLCIKGSSKLTSFGKFSNLAKHACNFILFYISEISRIYLWYKCLWVLWIGKTCECVDDKNIHVIFFLSIYVLHCLFVLNFIGYWLVFQLLFTIMY